MKFVRFEKGNVISVYNAEKSLSSRDIAIADENKGGHCYDGTNWNDDIYRPSSDTSSNHYYNSTNWNHKAH